MLNPAFQPPTPDTGAAPAVLGKSGRAFRATAASRTARPLLLPITPARYLRLRREAAKLTIDEVATRLAPNAAGRGEAAALVRLLETDKRNTVARHRDTIARLAAIVPLDPDVYFQLATEEEDRHPQICRSCGCSRNDPCTGDRGVCSWDGPGHCSRCAEEA